jgi:spore germination protein KA
MVSKTLGDNRRAMEELFFTATGKDVVIRDFLTGAGVGCFLVFIDGMAGGDTINDFIIRPLALTDRRKGGYDAVLQTSSVKSTARLADAVEAVLDGDTAVFIDGESVCYACETKGFDKRSPTTPNTENSVKGAQEAFTESLRTNTTLIHRALKTRMLITETVRVGDINRGMVAIMYLGNIVNKKILAEVKKRLGSIRGDFILGSGMLEQMIEDSHLSLFPSLLSTERPDRAAYYLASGRIVLVADGSPFVTVLPVTLSLLLDSPEGSNQRWQNGTFQRLIRLFALFCTTMLSGTYLALILYHREMIPTPLLGAIMNSRENIPFPSVFEVLIMELFFELVRESSLRIPHMLGSAIGIVGALILGQSAVDANLVSPVTLIVVALSGLGNAALPDYDLAFGIRTVKVFIIIMGASFGFLGLAVAIMVIAVVLANQNSFGVSMLSMQSVRNSAGSPLFYQRPLWKQEKRPEELGAQKKYQEPHISRPWVYEQGEE